MSSLIVDVCKIEDIKVHSGADRLEIAEVKGWQCIVKKGQYKKGDKIVFIPPDSILPVELADKLEVRNYLAGKNKDRVKCAKLRGEMSYGLIIYCENNEWDIGTDVAEYYGITKYIPPLRGFAGDKAPVDIYFDKLPDIENIRNIPDIFQEKEMVAITEKIDGSFATVGVSFIQLTRNPINEELCQEYYLLNDTTEEFKYGIWKASSHRVNRKRPLTMDEIKKNPYWYPYLQDPIYNLIEHLILDKKHQHVQIFGETYGGDISGGFKSLNYGQIGDYGFVAFALYIDHKKITFKEFYLLCMEFEVRMVPLIGLIPYDFKAICALSQGNSVLAEYNNAKHIREGVVVCSYDKDDRIAKFLNPDYLLLKEKGKIQDFTDE